MTFGVKSYRKFLALGAICIFPAQSIFGSDAVIPDAIISLLNEYAENRQGSYRQNVSSLVFIDGVLSSLDGLVSGRIGDLEVMLVPKGKSFISGGPETTYLRLSRGLGFFDFQALVVEFNIEEQFCSATITRDSGL